MDLGFATMKGIAFALLVLCLPAKGDRRRSQFIGFTSFEQFQIETNRSGLRLISPALRPDVNWNELVPSWNFEGTNGLAIEAKVIYPDHETKWYSFGDWAAEAISLPRQSLKNQQDVDGTVLTDTLRMKGPGGSVRVRATLRGTKSIKELKLLGFSFCDTASHYPASNPQTNVWGKSLRVPERSQASYAEGINSWCSPTAVSMIMAYWGEQLHRSELNYDVREAARRVNDPEWPGTGNWAFNVAFAGAHAGMRAYVTRLSDVSELEEWIERGVPVAVSVSYSALRGEPNPDSGHLVVCIGFTEAGDVLVNDPGRSQVRQVYTRANLVKAWRHSENTVYLIYPENQPTPLDRFGHWLK
jgi:hypothetical protein